jgi:hypothetical protein
VARTEGIYEASPLSGPILQGELLSGVVQTFIAEASVAVQTPGSVAAVEFMQHPFAIVVSQDCDLDWDHRQRAAGDGKTDKLLPNVMLCEVHDAASNTSNSSLWGPIRTNKNERFQFLQAPSWLEDLAREKFPELLVDFKRYFSVPTAELYARIHAGQTKRRCVLRQPFREHFSNRFFGFQMRIALPGEHFSES